MVASKKKILFYNWIQFDRVFGHGGGVNVYQDNLIKELIKSGQYDIYFLSSGTTYGLLNKKPHIIKTKNKYWPNCKSFELVNSACAAPMSIMYDSLGTYRNDESCYEILKDFVNDIGGVDIIHFNNIEGLSAKCLGIKKEFPNTKVIFSMHNYAAVFPNVNLLYEKKNNGYELEFRGSKAHAVRFYRIKSFCYKCRVPGLSEKIRDMYSFIKGATKRKTSGQETGDKFFISEKELSEYQKCNVSYINKYVDLVLAVSDRTRDIAIKYGVDKKKVITEYIGVDFKQKTKKLPVSKDYITIGYMGYASKMKGFEFFIEALEKMSPEKAKKVRIKCYALAAKPDEKERADRFLELKDKFDSLTYENGYKHAELEKILRDIDLGVVPVIWEDNLPQVAIEYAVHGIPVLASDMGGAQELSSSKKFVFKAGDVDDFLNKLYAIINDATILNDYIDNLKKIPSVEDHINRLIKYYEK